MTAVREDTCIGLFGFAVNLISSKKQPNKHNFEISQVDAVPHQDFFLAYWYMCQDFNKSIGEHIARETDKSYGSIYLIFDAKQLNRVIK